MQWLQSFKHAAMARANKEEKEEGEERADEWTLGVSERK